MYQIALYALLIVSIVLSAGALAHELKTAHQARLYRIANGDEDPHALPWSDAYPMTALIIAAIVAGLVVLGLRMGQVL